VTYEISGDLAAYWFVLSGTESAPLEWRRATPLLVCGSLGRIQQVSRAFAFLSALMLAVPAPRLEHIRRWLNGERAGNPGRR